MSVTPTNTTSKITESKNSNGLDSQRQIYHTTYKKGPILGNLHFEHDGGFEAAVNDVKIYLSNKSLKHIHTVPFLVDIKSPIPSEEI